MGLVMRVGVIVLDLPIAYQWLNPPERAVLKMLFEGYTAEEIQAGRVPPFCAPTPQAGQSLSSKNSAPYSTGWCAR